jgi:hypothetical protein
MSDERIDPSAMLERGAVTDAVTVLAAAVLGGAATGAANAYVADLLDRPPKDEPKKIIVPSGSSDD